MQKTGAAYFDVGSIAVTLERRRGQTLVPGPSRRERLRGGAGDRLWWLGLEGARVVTGDRHFGKAFEWWHP